MNPKAESIEKAPPELITEIKTYSLIKNVDESILALNEYLNAREYEFEAFSPNELAE